MKKSKEYLTVRYSTGLGSVLIVKDLVDLELLA